jgi:hypothetical protein
MCVLRCVCVCGVCVTLCVYVCVCASKDSCVYVCACGVRACLFSCVLRMCARVVRMHARACVVIGALHPGRPPDFAAFWRCTRSGWVASWRRVHVPVGSISSQA